MWLSIKTHSYIPSWVRLAPECLPGTSTSRMQSYGALVRLVFEYVIFASICVFVCVNTTRGYIRTMQEVACTFHDRGYKVYIHITATLIHKRLRRTLLSKRCRKHEETLLTKSSANGGGGATLTPSGMLSYTHSSRFEPHLNHPHWERERYWWWNMLCRTNVNQISAHTLENKMFAYMFGANVSM